MSSKYALFPLNLVVYPGEDLNLHVFEPRYKQLVEDCSGEDNRFIIPAYVHNKIEYGTEMTITRIAKKYQDGRYDIETKGLRACKVTAMQNPYEDKLYAVGEIEYLPDQDNGDVMLKEELYESINKLFELANVDEQAELNDLKVFNYAHKIGLSKEVQYELLKITEERKRQRFMLDHLHVIIHRLKDLERAKERIKMNGHFRHFNPLEY